MVGRTPYDGARLEACVRAARAKRISVSQEHHASIFGGKIGEFKAAASRFHRCLQRHGYVAGANACAGNLSHTAIGREANYGRR